MAQRALDVLALHFRQRLGLVAPICRCALPEIGRQVLDPDRRLAAREDHRPLEHIAHLAHVAGPGRGQQPVEQDRKSTRLNSSHPSISYAVFCLKKTKKKYKLLLTKKTKKKKKNKKKKKKKQ